MQSLVLFLSSLDWHCEEPVEPCLVDNVAVMAVVAAVVVENMSREIRNLHAVSNLIYEVKKDVIPFGLHPFWQ